MQSTAEFSMPLLDEAAINRRRCIGKLVIWALVLACFVGCAYVVGTAVVEAKSPGSVLQWGLVALATVVASIVATIVYGLLFVKPLVMLLHCDPDDYMWLDASGCNALAELCEQTPGLVPYRDRVRAANRRFTCCESDAMFVWAREQQYHAYVAEDAERVRAGCQRLYGIAQD